MIDDRHVSPAGKYVPPFRVEEDGSVTTCTCPEDALRFGSPIDGCPLHEVKG